MPPPTRMPFKARKNKKNALTTCLNVAARRPEREGTIAEREWPVISLYVCVCEPSETNRQVSLTFFAAKQHTHTHSHSQTILCALFSAAFASFPSPPSAPFALLPCCRCCFFSFVVAAAFTAYAVNCLALNLDARLLIAPHSLRCHAHTCMHALRCCCFCIY